MASFLSVLRFLNSVIGTLWIASIVVILLWLAEFVDLPSGLLCLLIVTFLLQMVSEWGLRLMMPGYRGSASALLPSSTSYLLLEHPVFSDTELFNGVPDNFIARSRVKIRNFYLFVMRDKDSKKIVIFLSMNFCFMFVELMYGLITNSLGLISDAMHMMFDCSALVIGLYAAYTSKWRPDSKYSFGYGRMEVLCGFINAIFLVFIALTIAVESMERIMEPPHVHHNQLLAVSSLGLGVNLVGVMFFHEFHGGQGGHSHGDGGDAHAHCHSSSHRSENLEGVFLHILADTLGSVGVIASSLLIKYCNLMIADPICSMFISIMIFVSVLPLCRNAALILLQSIPRGSEDRRDECLRQVSQLPGVLGYCDPHFWTLSGDLQVGTIRLQAADDSDHSLVLSKATDIFKSCGFGVCTIQIESQSFYIHHPHVFLDANSSQGVPNGFGDSGRHHVHSSECGHSHLDASSSYNLDAAMSAGLIAPPMSFSFSTPPTGVTPNKGTPNQIPAYVKPRVPSSTIGSGNTTPNHSQSSYLSPQAWAAQAGLVLPARSAPPERKAD